MSVRHDRTFRSPVLVVLCLVLLVGCEDDSDRLVTRLTDLDTVLIQNDWSCKAMADATSAWLEDHEGELTELLAAVEERGELPEVAKRVGQAEAHERALEALAKCSAEPVLSRVLLRLARVLGSTSTSEAAASARAEGGA